MTKAERREKYRQDALKGAAKLKAQCSERWKEDSHKPPKDSELKTLQDILSLTKVRKRSKRGRPPTVKGKIDGKTWDYKTRVQAVLAYSSVGTIKGASEITGVPEATIRDWRKQPWWEELKMELRERKNEEIDAKMTEIIDMTLETQKDRLINGDAKWDSKRGIVVRVPVTMKDAAVVAAINYDKRALQRGEATQRVEKVTTEQRLASLSKTFTQFATGEVVEGDFEEVGE